MMLALLLALAQGDASRLQAAHVELAGPLERVRFDLGAAGETVLTLPLAAGETRTLDVPLPAWEGMRGIEPRIAVEPPGAGGARFRGWAPDNERQAFWDGLPIGLRSLPRPIPPESRPSVRLWHLLLAAALFAATLRARRSPAAALAIGVLGAGLLAAGVLAGADSHSGAIVCIDGDAREQRYLRIASRRDRIEATLPVPPVLEVDPPRERLALAVWPVRGSSALGWSAAAPGAVLHRVDSYDGFGARELDRERNRFAAFARVWLREGDGTWTFRGAWGPGEPLPAPLAGPAPAPPGWLNPALPQGVSILLAEVEAPASGEPPDADWVRILGF